MKRTYLLFFSMVLAACKPVAESASSASNVHTQNPTIENVVAKWTPTSFNAASATFSPNNHSKFFTEFKNVVDKSGKGEFETTAAYKERIKNVDDVIEPFSVGDDYGFVLGRSDAALQYNADAQKYETLFPIFCMTEWPLNKGVSCQIDSVTDSTENYTGQNSFGARAEVTKVRGRDFYFVFNPTDLKKTRFNRDRNNMYRLSIACPVPVEKAKLLQGKNVLAAIVVSLRNPEIFSGYPRIEDATVASPQGQYYESIGIPAKFKRYLCFVQETGEVLYMLGS